MKKKQADAIAGVITRSSEIAEAEEKREAKEAKKAGRPPLKDPNVDDDGERYSEIHRGAIISYLRVDNMERLPKSLWKFGKKKLKRWWLELPASERDIIELDAAILLKRDLWQLTRSATRVCMDEPGNMKSNAIAIGILVDKQMCMGDLISSIESRIDSEHPKRTKNELKIAG